MAGTAAQSKGELLQKRIAQRAYAIWESEGRPNGADMEHWLKAETEIAAQSGARKSDGSPEGPTKKRKVSAKK